MDSVPARGRQNVITLITDSNDGEALAEAKSPFAAKEYDNFLPHSPCPPKPLNYR